MLSRYGDDFNQSGAEPRTPTMSTMGGTTIGRIVMKSIIGRSLGKRRCTKMAVGTIKSSSTTAVKMARRIERKKAAENPSDDGSDWKAQNEK
jgi:hypothetical protein